MHLASFRRKNIQMLATLMATATYAAGFNPPGGVWQDAAGHLPGDPVMRSTQHHRYLVFFYFNAAAFALSLMVVVVTLILATCPKEIGPRFDVPLLLLMVMATVAFLVGYGTGACRDKFRIIVFSLMVTALLPTCFIPLFMQSGNTMLTKKEKYRGELIAPLSMFALTISYVGGLSTPGGFWDSAEGGHRPGDEILHGQLLHLFSWFNTEQFVSSLHGVFFVMCSGMHVSLAAINMMGGQFGLIVAYTAGTSRGRRSTVGVICSLCAAIWVYAMICVVLRVHFSSFLKELGSRFSFFLRELGSLFSSLLQKVVACFSKAQGDGTGSREQKDAIVQGSQQLPQKKEGSEQEVLAEREKKFAAAQQRRREASLVQLLAGLAVSITYQAGMYPPGGVWQNSDKAGDPILLTTNPGRYRAFFYCNSVAFVASLLAILLGQKSYLTEQHALQAAMILDLLALIVAYAIGSCRDQISSMYVLGIAAAAVVYVVVHVQYFTLGSGTATCTDEDGATLDKKGRRFILFAILVASITYQAGLTTPGGFLLQYDGAGPNRVGDPVLLYNYPRRYKAFFYCNSVSFMVSTVLLLFLVNPNMYRPAIRSRALSLCSAVSFACLIGAFAAGSTQHLKTSIHIFVVAGVAVILCLPVLVTVLYYYYRPSPDPPVHDPSVHDPPVQTGDEERDDHSLNKIFLMTLAILVACVTYQGGLDPPGGSWQSGSHAGHPVMHDKRRNRYLAFLCGNSTSFVASIYLIEILITKSKVMQMAIGPLVVAQYLGFLVAYAAGSSRQWKTSAHVATLVTAVLAYVAIHVTLTICIKKKTHRPSDNSVQQQAQAQAPAQAPAQAQASSVVNKINIAEGP